MARPVAMRLAVCLAAGGALSIGGAWGCKLYYWKLGSPQSSYTVRDRHGYWNVSAWKAPGRRSYTLLPIQFDPAGSLASPGSLRTMGYWVDSFITSVDAGRMDMAAVFADLLIAGEAIPGGLALAVAEEARGAGRFPRALAALEHDPTYGATGRHLRSVCRLSRAAPTVPGWVRRPAPGSGIGQLATGAYGWPVVCMKSEMEIAASGRPTNRYIGSLMIDPNAAPRGMACTLPLTPVLHGLALDAAAYGGALAVVLLLLPRERRKRRVRAGLCPGCRYDLQYDFETGCPECGWGRGPGVSLEPTIRSGACEDALAAAPGYKQDAVEGAPEPGRSL